MIHPNMDSSSVPQGKLVAQGRLLLQDTFLVADPEGGLLGRMKERRVFLFEQLVIFSEPLDKKRGFSMPGFLYKNSIKVKRKITLFLLSLQEQWVSICALLLKPVYSSHIYCRR